MTDPQSSVASDGPQAAVRHLVVPRTARYYLLGTLPDGPDGEGSGASAAGGVDLAPRELWIVVHGYAQLAGRFIRHFVPLDDGSRVIVAPEGLSRFYLEHPGRAGSASTRVGATWMTREDRDAEIQDHVRYLDLLAAQLLDAFGTLRPRIHVLGFSQGVATVTRWLARGRVRADRLILWSGRIPADLFPLPADHALRQSVIDIVTGDQDELATPEVLREQQELVDGAGLRPRRHRHPDGHRLHAPTLLALARS